MASPFFFCFSLSANWIFFFSPRFFIAYLRLQGEDAQNHAVYTELKRVQRYFGKIKAVEEPEGRETRNVVVNREAAARVLKADLVFLLFCPPVAFEF